jgi:hypothetical protein
VSRLTRFGGGFGKQCHQRQRQSCDNLEFVKKLVQQSWQDDSTDMGGGVATISVATSNFITMIGHFTITIDNFTIILNNVTNI